MFHSALSFLSRCCWYASGNDLHKRDFRWILQVKFVDKRSTERLLGAIGSSVKGGRGPQWNWMVSCRGIPDISELEAPGQRPDEAHNCSNGSSAQPNWPCNHEFGK